MPEPQFDAAPLSPCINVCTLDDRGLCRGCLRTVEEITRWTRLTPRQQWDVIAACTARRPAAGAPAVPVRP